MRDYLTDRVIIATLALLLTISIVMAITAYMLPPTWSEEVIMAEIDHKATVTYTAEVNESLIYNNETKLPEGVPLYKRLLKSMDIWIDYEVSSPQGIAKVQGEATPLLTLVSVTWTKTFPIGDKIEVNGTRIHYDGYLNLTEVNELISQLEKETGTMPREVNVSLILNIRLTVTTGEGSVYIQQASPTLTLMLDKDEPLVKVEKRGLSHTYLDKKVETYPVYIGSGSLKITVASARVVFLLTSIVLAPALVIMYMRREKREETELEKIMKKYGDLVTEGRILSLEGKTVVEVNQFKKLAELADAIQEPIIKQGNEFYLIDNEVVYKYIIKEK